MPKTIRMLRDFPVALDGVTVETWEKGREIVGVDDALADDLMHPQTAAAEEVKAEEPAARPAPVSPARRASAQ